MAWYCQPFQGIEHSPTNSDGKTARVPAFPANLYF